MPSTVAGNKIPLLKITLLLLFAMVFCAGSLKIAGATHHGTAEKNHIRTIIVDNYQPYTFKNGQGMPDGFSVDLLRAVAREMGMNVDIRVDTWEHAKNALELSAIDVLPMMAYSVERDKVYDFSLPHTIAYDAIFINKASPIIHSLAALHGKTVIVMKNDAAHDYLVSSGLSKNIRLILVDSLPEAMKQLAAGNGDAAIMPKLVGIVTLQRLGMTGIVSSPDVIDEYNRPFSFAVKDGNQALLERLNHGLRIIKANGQYSDIYAKWFAILEDPHIHRKTALKYAVAMTLVWVAFLVWSLALRRQVRSRTKYLEAEIAQRKQAEEKSLETGELLSSYMQQSPIYTYIKEVTPTRSIVLRASDNFYNMLGIPAGDMAGKDMAELFPPEFATKIIADDWAVVSNGVVVRLDEELNGRSYTTIKFPIVQKERTLLAGYTIDVTDRKQSEVLLRRNEMRLQCLVEISQYQAKDIHDLLDYSLEQAIKMTGSKIGYIYTYYEDRKEFVLNSWSAGVMKECTIQEKQTVYQLDKTGIWGEAVRQRRSIIVNDFDAPDPFKKGYPEGDSPLQKFMTLPVFSHGKIVAVIGLANKQEDYDQLDVVQVNLLISSVWKMVQRIRAEEALLDSEERFRTLFENATSGVALHEIVLDSQGHPVDYIFLQANPAFQKHTGMCVADILGKRATETHPGIEKTGLIQIYGNVALTGEVASFDLDFAIQGRYYHVSAYQSGKGRFAAVIDDITDRKMKDEEIAKKNAEMERFTYTASHDLRSPLVTIKTFLGFLKEDLAERNEEKVAKDIEYMAVAANKMGVLLDELLEISRVGRVVNNPVRVTFRELAEEAVSAVAGRIAEKKVIVHVDEIELVLTGDRPRLAEIWQNLIENAVKYMGDQKAPEIVIGVERSGAETAFFVRDNGMGIDPRYQDKVFVLFDKLDAKSEGSGLGLALVKRIVELNKGRIWVESEGAGKGSCFKFTLPEAGKGD